MRKSSQAQGRYEVERGVGARILRLVQERLIVDERNESACRRVPAPFEIGILAT